jgi:glycolate dehydrogenase FAD-binding subunit
LDDSTCTIDGVGPFPVVRPGTVEAVAGLVRQASAEGQALFPLGGQTMLGVGLPPERAGLGIDLRGLDAVIDYPARDMTITVQAGITIGRLQSMLAGENQRLPVDVPHPEQATLGGALAVNASGPRRYGCGTFRDYVIGMTTVNDEGQQTKAGGRVVKNVAGYDLPKLHVGALGTLGIITQVTLKLRPRPEESALLAFRADPTLLECLLDGVHSSRTRPVCVEVLNPRLGRLLAPRLPRWEGPEGAWVLIAGFEESAATVRWQVQQMIKEVPAGKVYGLDALVNDTAEPLWQFLRDFCLDVPAPQRTPPRPHTALPKTPGPCSAGPPAAGLTFKANLLPHAVAAFALRADALHPGLLLQAHAGSGIVIGHIPDDLTLEQAGSLLAELQTLAAAARGNVVVLRCPAAWKKTLPIWGVPRGDAGLMRAVREKFDPQGLFNPGRFLTG